MTTHVQQLGQLHVAIVTQQQKIKGIEDRIAQLWNTLEKALQAKRDWDAAAPSPPNVKRYNELIKKLPNLSKAEKEEMEALKRNHDAQSAKCSKHFDKSLELGKMHTRALEAYKNEKSIAESALAIERAKLQALQAEFDALK